MNDSSGRQQLFAIPGDGVLARQGDLVLLTTIDERGLLDRLLELLTRASEGGDDGSRFTGAVASLIENDETWGDPGGRPGPALVAFGRAGAGLAVTVTGTAWADIVTPHGASRVMAGQPSTLLHCLVGVPVQAVRAGLETGGGRGERTDRFSRLEAGTVRAGGLSYHAALPAAPPPPAAAGDVAAAPMPASAPPGASALAASAPAGPDLAGPAAGAAPGSAPWVSAAAGAAAADAAARAFSAGVPASGNAGPDAATDANAVLPGSDAGEGVTPAATDVSGRAAGDADLGDADLGDADLGDADLGHPPWEGPADAGPLAAAEQPAAMEPPVPVPPPAASVDALYDPAGLPGAAPSAAAEPFGAEPVPAESFGAEPFGAQPLPAEPFGAEPLGAEPVPAESFSAEPVPAEPVPAESFGAGPFAQEQPAGEPPAAGQETMWPPVPDPTAAGPGPALPGPGFTQADPAEPPPPAYLPAGFAPQAGPLPGGPLPADPLHAAVPQAGPLPGPGAGPLPGPGAGPLPGPGAGPLPGPPPRPMTEVAQVQGFAAAAPASPPAPPMAAVPFHEPTGIADMPVREPTGPAHVPPPGAGLSGNGAGPGANPPIVLGVLCKNGHFGDPETRNCLMCGASRRRGQAPQPGPRPPLGALVLDDNSVLMLDADTVVGRDPAQDPSVMAGEAHPLRLVDEEMTVSRIHARVHLEGWRVYLVDLGSANGTRVLAPGGRGEQVLQPNVPVLLQGGTRIFVGTQGFRYESRPAR